MSKTSSSELASARANDFYGILKARKVEIEARHRELTPASAVRFEVAKRVIPGGYTRDAIMRDPYPIFIARGEGSTVTDVDGRTLDDWCLNATSLALGHADPKVVAAATEQTALGSAFHSMTGHETALAELLCDRLPSAEKVRFTNSGSEAAMLGLRIARGFTGRTLIVKFEGSYHGTYDDVQWSVGPSPDAFGSSKSPNVVADSSGLAGNDGRVLVLPYNDPEALRDLLSQRGDEIAAVIVEPMANRMGLVVPKSEFLAAARAACDVCGAVLIFDEVIAYRLGYGGAQTVFDITPDLTTLGKSIGGGFPVGAVAGRADIMAVTEPGHAGRVTHAGTYNGNPVTMAAGLATQQALTPDVVEAIEISGERIRSELRRMTEQLPLSVSGGGPFFKVNATAAEIVNYRDTITCDKEWQRLAAMTLFNSGVVISGSMAGCIASTTTDAQIDALLAGVEAIVRL